MTGKQFLRIALITFAVAFSILAAKAISLTGQPLIAIDFLDWIESLSAESQSPNGNTDELTPAESEVPTPSATIFIRIEPTSTSTAAPTPTVYGTAKISCEDGIIRAALRRSPGYLTKDDEVDVLEEIPCGETVILLGPTLRADNISWWNAIWNGTEGWIAQNTGSGKTILIFDD